MLNIRQATEAKVARKDMERYKQKVENEGLHVVKCSGKALGSSVMECIAGLKASGKMKNLVLVHGGGAQITQEMERLGMKPVFSNGYRITDARTMAVVEQVLNKINKDVVESLRRCGICAEQFQRGVFHGKSMKRGMLGWLFSKDRYGRITEVSCSGIANTLVEGKVAVLSPIGENKKGMSLNLNADDAAVSAAIALGATAVVLATDVDGIMANSAVVSEITAKGLERLMKDGTVNGGMVAKARACIQAAKAGISVRIINGNKEGTMEKALDKNKCGTMVLPIE